MLVFRIPRLRVLQLQDRRYARYILPDLPLAPAPPKTSLPSTGDDKPEIQSGESAMDNGTGNVYTCAECDVKLTEIFYLCTACEGQILSLTWMA